MKVLLLAAITADGFIAQDNTQLSLEWTSREDKRFLVRLTKKAGVMIMGSSTFATIKREIKGRKIIVLSSKQVDNQFNKENTEVKDGELKNILFDLAEQGYEEVVIAGGASVYAQFLEQGLVDELYLTIEPIMFGNGVSLLNKAFLQKLMLLEVIDLSSQTKVMHYKVVR